VDEVSYAPQLNLGTGTLETTEMIGRDGYLRYCQSWFLIGIETPKSGIVGMMPADPDVEKVGLGLAYIFTLVS
jgi:hypothetical protein